MAGYLNSAEAAEYLGITPAALRKLVELGEITFYKPRGRLFFTLADLDAHMNQGRVEAWA